MPNPAPEAVLAQTRAESPRAITSGPEGMRWGHTLITPSPALLRPWNCSSGRRREQTQLLALPLGGTHPGLIQGTDPRGRPPDTPFSILSPRKEPPQGFRGQRQQHCVSPQPCQPWDLSPQPSSPAPADRQGPGWASWGASTPSYLTPLFPPAPPTPISPFPAQTSSSPPC